MREELVREQAPSLRGPTMLEMKRLARSLERQAPWNAGARFEGGHHLPGGAGQRVSLTQNQQAEAAEAAGTGDLDVSERQHSQSAPHLGYVPVRSATAARLAAGRPVGGPKSGFRHRVMVAHPHGGHVSSISIPSKHAPITGDVALEQPTERWYAGASSSQDPFRIASNLRPYLAPSPAPPLVQPASPPPVWSIRGSHGTTYGTISTTSEAQPQPRYPDRGLDSRPPRPSWGRLSHSVSVLEVRRALEMACESLSQPGGGSATDLAVVELLTRAYDELTGAREAGAGLSIPEVATARLLGREPSADALDSAREAAASARRGGAAARAQARPLRSASRHRLEDEPDEWTSHDAWVSSPSFPPRQGGPPSTVGPSGAVWEGSLRAPAPRRELKHEATPPQTESPPSPVFYAGATWPAAFSGPVSCAIAGLAGGVFHETRVVSKDAAPRVLSRPATPSIPFPSETRSFPGERPAESLCSGSAFPARERADRPQPRRRPAVAPQPARAAQALVVTVPGKPKAPEACVVTRVVPQARPNLNSTTGRRLAAVSPPPPSAGPRRR